MEGKKLTAEEIIEIIKNSDMSVGVYAMGADYDYYDDYDDDDDNERRFIFPQYILEHEDVEKYNKEVEAARKAYANHPAYGKDMDDEELIELRDKYWNLNSSSYILSNIFMEHELKLGKVVNVEQKGGTDEGSEWYIIKHFVEHDVYIKTDGYYSSYEGTDFHKGFGYKDIPKQKMITYYVKDK